MMLSRRTLLGLGLATGGLSAALATTTSHFSDAMRRARQRLADLHPEQIETRFGRMAYAEAGNGPPVLMIHGSGGGYDQGLLFAAPLVEAGFRVIALSRFGYPGSDFPDDPSSENQADAFVDLLDRLGIGEIVVAGGSAGALSALAFAIRHPDRCRALIPIVPAAFAPGRPPARPWSVTQERMITSALQSDLLFWTLMWAVPDRMIKSLLATDPALLAKATPKERQRVHQILEAILPVSARARGLMNDMRLAGDPADMPIETISAPTLAISLEDDLYLTADAARHIAEKVPGASLKIYPTGGHVWVGRDQEMFADIIRFLKEVLSR